jgi:hypothetical protein
MTLPYRDFHERYKTLVAWAIISILLIAAISTSSICAPCWSDPSRELWSVGDWLRDWLCLDGGPCDRLADSFTEPRFLLDVFWTIGEGYLLNNFLPFGSGKSGGAFLLSRKSDMQFLEILPTIVIERAMDLAILRSFY